MAWKLGVHPWQMLDLTPPELDAYIALTNQLAKEPRV